MFLTWQKLDNKHCHEGTITLLKKWDNVSQKLAIKSELIKFPIYIRFFPFQIQVI